MGLGPPVCVDCGVIGHLSEGRGWRCPNCGDKHLTGSLWLYKTLERAQIEINTQIVEENKGHQPGDK